MNVEREAVAIVRQEELDRGWTPEPLLSKTQERLEGCDFFSTPPDGGPAHPIEVKGWGEPLIKANGSFTYPADVNAQQFERAQRDPTWRLEIVANLTAFLAGLGPYQRLTLSGGEVVERATPWKYTVTLEGLSGRVKELAPDG
jgi:hypothetical protein